MTARRTGVLRRRALVAWLIMTGQLRGALRWYLRPALRRETRERAALLLRDTPRAGEARRIARSQILERGVHWQLSGHFGWACDIAVDGAEHLRQVVDEGNGVVLVTAHTSWTMGIGWRLAREGLPYLGVTGGWVEHSTSPGPLRERALIADWKASGGGVIVAGKGAFQQARAHVEAGHVVGLAVDMPGSLEVDYLGKKALVGQAAFRIAWETGAPVVPAFARRTGLTMSIEVLPALRPEEHSDFDAWKDAVMAVVSGRMLAGAHHGNPLTPSLLWPGGDAQAARPNRDAWAERLSESRR